MVYDVIKQSTSLACSSRLYNHDSLPGHKQNKTDVPLSLKQSNILYQATKYAFLLSLSIEWSSVVLGSTSVIPIVTGFLSGFWSSGVEMRHNVLLGWQSYIIFLKAKDMTN